MDIEQLIDTYGDYLYRIAYIYTKDASYAEEVVQDVFWKFHQTQQYDGRASVKTYLTKMTINRSYDYLRSWRGRTNTFFGQMKQTVQAAETEALKQHERGEITQAVLRLPVKYREVLLYYYYEDLPIQDIADLLEAPVSTVKSRLQRGRVKLRELLPREQWEVLKDA